MTQFIIAGLAAWRVTRLLLHEDGPGDVFLKLRHEVGADRPGELRGIALAFNCLWCMSIWVAAGVTIIASFGKLGRWLTLVPAVSAAAIIIEQYQREE